LLFLCVLCGHHVSASRFIVCTQHGPKSRVAALVYLPVMSRRRRKAHDPTPATPDPGFGDPLFDERPVRDLDLHGSSAPEAERKVLDFVQTMVRVAPGQVVRIITGKGLNSPGLPVLRRVVEQVLAGKAALFVVEWRADPFGGGVRVRVRG
jgi:hypothetical protein